MDVVQKMNLLNVKRIAIIFPEGNIVNNPSLLLIVEKLQLAGYALDIFTQAQPNDIYTPKQTLSLRVFKTPSIVSAFPFISDYCLIIGVDTGIIFAKILSDLHGIKYIYISYEIFFDAEIKNNTDFYLKKKSKAAGVNAALTIVPDKLRAHDIINEYGIQKERIIELPVAAGQVKHYQPSCFLHERLNIPPQKKILLFMGSLAKWTMLEEVITASNSLPPDWVLVLHGRYGVDSEIYSMTDKMNNIYISKTPAVDQLDFSQIIQSARCCIALYKPDFMSIYTGMNIKHIGLSSGKISTALQHGIPVIVNTGGEIDDIVQKFGCGFVLKKEDACVFKCLTNICEQDEMSKRCHSAYNEYFNNESRIGVFLKKIDNLQSNSSVFSSLDHALPLLIESIFRHLPAKYFITSLKLYVTIFIQRVLNKIFNIFLR